MAGGYPVLSLLTRYVRAWQIEPAMMRHFSYRPDLTGWGLSREFYGIRYGGSVHFLRGYSF